MCVLERIKEGERLCVLDRMVERKGGRSLVAVLFSYVLFSHSSWILVVIVWINPHSH